MISDLVTLVKYVNSGKPRPSKPHRFHSHWDIAAFWDVVIQGKVDAELAGSDCVSYGKFQSSLSCTDSKHVENDLKLILVVNSKGRWEVKWVGPPQIL